MADATSTSGERVDFYDCHCHTFMLNHPSLTAFLSRFLGETLRVGQDGGWWWWFIKGVLPVLIAVYPVIKLIAFLSGNISDLVAMPLPRWSLGFAMLVVGGAAVFSGTIEPPDSRRHETVRLMLMRLVPVLMAGYLLWLPHRVQESPAIWSLFFWPLLALALGVAIFFIWHGRRPLLPSISSLTFIGGMLMLVLATGHCFTRYAPEADGRALAFSVWVMLLLLLGAGGLAGDLFRKVRLVGQRVVNMLCYMENPIGNQFLRIEQDVRDMQKKRSFALGNQHYTHLVLTPLLMDFGEKRKSIWEVHYRDVARKPIELQVMDMLRGIRYYYARAGKPHLLDIYPFMGLNPRNYAFRDYITLCFKRTLPAKGQLRALLGECYAEEYSSNTLLMLHGTCLLNDDCKRVVKQIALQYECFLSAEDLDYFLAHLKRYLKKRNTLDAMLDKYFLPFPITRAALHQSLRSCKSSDIDDLHRPIFAGIKVYPPLGFDPWPNEPFERAKAEYLYAFCCAHQIPITTHCGGPGFQTVNEFERLKYTNPERWRTVLRNYPCLRIDFAHFGGEDPKWRETILDYIRVYDNVYADFAIRGCDKAYYGGLAELLAHYRATHSNQPEWLRSHILYGSDFFLTLSSMDSYDQYLCSFLATPEGEAPTLTADDCHQFAGVNPHEFLFGAAGRPVPACPRLAVGAQPETATPPCATCTLTPVS